MDENQFKQVLTQTLEEEIQDVELWKKMEGKLPAPSTKIVRHTWNAGKIAVVAASLMLATVVYAVYQGIVVPGDPGITSVEQADLLTFIGETQAIDGQFSDNDLSVTLDYAYADANRITIGYTVQGVSPDGQRMMAYSNPRLRTADGEPIDRLLLLADQETQGQPTDAGEREFSNTLTTNYVTPDTSLADGEALNLTLTVDVALSDLDAGEFPAPGMLMAGSVEFTFDVPFLTGTVVEIGETADVSDLSVSLQRAVFTPSMTVIEMCYDLPPVTRIPGWSPFVILSLDEEQVFVGQVETYGLDDHYNLNDPCQGVIVPLALEPQAGNWQIEITEFRELGGEGLEPISGPWEFSFPIADR